MTRARPARVPVVRLVALLAAALLAASLALTAFAGSAPPRHKAADGGYWWCVAIQEINFGYCQENPLG
jgi:hypothetical protein